MADTPIEQPEAEFQQVVKRLLNTPPQPKKIEKPAKKKPAPRKREK